MYNPHSIKYSFEKVIRVNDDLLTFEKSSFVIEAPIAVGGNNCCITLWDKEKTTRHFQSFLKIDYKTRSVKNENSHEDPLIEDSGYNLICFQVPLSMLNLKEVLVQIESDRVTIFEYLIDPEVLKSVTDKKLTQIDFEKNEIKSKESCELTLHLTDLNGEYEEVVIEGYDFKNPFQFEKLIGQYNYIGIQFSYHSDLIETEEKYILVGQKSMKFSQLVLSNSQKEIYPVIYNNKKFMPNENTAKFKEVININNLIHLMEIDPPYLFDISFDYIKQNYLKHPTYNQNKFFSSKSPNNIRTHLNLAVCKSCEFKSYCLQIIPSGLTEELFKKNIGIDTQQACKVYKIIDKTLKTTKS